MLIVFWCDRFPVGRLTDQSTLYVDNNNTRYWFSTEPSFTRLAQDRAEQIQQDQDKVYR
ncbi:hypothetical protein [Nostoc sp. FACHB-133]|uniref:hypothetical protein n=1 Tax=Nostoc sp. FACHB-133 TaxID=2692835 RepID=UPI0016834631|nr:hypothetical protein [Nostoc sp. FACHB-133]MBD2522136.1 hypothetical protein [Nostoc sp. FACHB-133]